MVASGGFVGFRFYGVGCLLAIVCLFLGDLLSCRLGVFSLVCFRLDCSFLR